MSILQKALNFNTVFSKVSDLVLAGDTKFETILQGF